MEDEEVDFTIDTRFNDGDSYSTGFWIKDNVFYPIARSHIRTILNDHEFFGFESKEELVQRFKDHNEKIGQEGKARKEIILEVIGQGWIRARYHDIKNQQYLTLNVSRKSFSERYVDELEVFLKDRFFIPKDVPKNVEWVEKGFSIKK